MFYSRRISSNTARAAVTVVAVAASFHAGAAGAPPLSATIIDGTTSYNASELFASYRDQLGRPITSTSAQSIVAQIEALYLRDGYARPELRVYADMAADGILRVEVFEAQITDVVFSGDAGPYADDLAQIAADLRARVPLRTVDLRHALQRMRELPGLTVSAATRRDETRRNAHIVKVDTQFARIEGSIELSNRATRQIGPVFVTGQLIANNPLGLHERAGVLFAAANDEKEFSGAGAFLDAPLNDDGAHLTASFFSSRSNPTEEIDRDDHYMRDRAVLRATQPGDVGDTTRVSYSFGVDFDDLDITRGNVRLRDERLRIVELGARVNGAFTTKTPYAYSVQLRHGFDGLGAQLDARDLHVDRRRLDFTALRMQLTQLYRFNERWSGRIDALAQQSGYILPDAERYKIGGERLGRGFEVTEIAGDQGAGAKVELRRSLSTELLTSASLYGFYDFGAAWKQNGGERESASSSGLGFALEYGILSGFVEVAMPLTSADIEGDRDAKVFAELRLKL